jgi:plasmid replication initiation protein
MYIYDSLHPLRMLSKTKTRFYYCKISNIKGGISYIVDGMYLYKWIFLCICLRASIETNIYDSLQPLIMWSKTKTPFYYCKISHINGYISYRVEGIYKYISI